MRVLHPYAEFNGNTTALRQPYRIAAPQRLPHNLCLSQLCHGTADTAQQWSVRRNTIGWSHAASFYSASYSLLGTSHFYRLHRLIRQCAKLFLIVGAYCDLEGRP